MLHASTVSSSLIKTRYVVLQNISPGTSFAVLIVWQYLAALEYFVFQSEYLLAEEVHPTEDTRNLISSGIMIRIRSLRLLCFINI
jgi:hypothetical protein